MSSNPLHTTIKNKISHLININAYVLRQKRDNFLETKFIVFSRKFHSKLSLRDVFKKRKYFVYIFISLIIDKI